MAEPAADVSSRLLLWAARHWVVASVLVYGLLCNVLIFYYVERSERRRRAATTTTLPQGGAAGTRPPARYDSGVLSAAEAADAVQQWPVKATEDAEAAWWFHYVFGKQRVRADVLARRPDSPPWELSNLYAALLCVGTASIVVEGLDKYWHGNSEPTAFNIGCAVLRGLLLAGQAVCSVLG